MSTAPEITQRRLRRLTIDLRDTKKFSGSHDDAFLVVGLFTAPCNASSVEARHAVPERDASQPLPILLTVKIHVILSAAKDLNFRNGCARC